ncbi:unnamed protein product, partial [Rhizoctonia solani]
MSRSKPNKSAKPQNGSRKSGSRVANNAPPKSTIPKSQKKARRKQLKKLQKLQQTSQNPQQSQQTKRPKRVQPVQPARAIQPVQPAHQPKQPEQPKQPKQPEQSNFVHHRAYLKAFFAKYPSFSYDSSRPVMSEFYHMCDHFRWERGDEEREEARDYFKDALVQEFNTIYGTDHNSLVAWQSLCRVLNLDVIPGELEACRQLVKSMHVNIVDLVDTRATQAPVTHFPSEAALSSYTISTGKYFPKESAYAGGLLSLTSSQACQDLPLTMTSQPLLSAKNLGVLKDKDTPIFSDVSFDLHEGDILVLQGRSGGGKSTILKALAHLNVYQGDVKLHGEPPSKYGIPAYRTRVLYVPQRPSMLPSTPRHFLTTINGFSSRASHKEKAQSPTYGAASSEHDDDRTQFGSGPQDPFQIAKEWGLADDVWDRGWVTLSGGEAQRVLLAIAAGLRGTEVLLLDEPTSALDGETSAFVEKTLTELPKSAASVKAIVWITHSREQSERVGTRWINVTGHGIEESDSSE